MVEIVAEISGNHGGDINKAERLIFCAALAGCDYVKFQYYKPEDMPDRHVGDNDRMYRELMVPESWLPRLFAQAKKLKVGLFASVFSLRALEEILKYDVPYVKIASPLSTRLDSSVYDAIQARTPVEVELIWSGVGPYASPGKTLYCPEGHPAVITKRHFSEFRRGSYFGLSDHTTGIAVPLAFIRAGAEMIEKHLKLAGDDDCVDAAFSADPDTMGTLCTLVQ